MRRRKRVAVAGFRFLEATLALPLRRTVHESEFLGGRGTPGGGGNWSAFRSGFRGPFISGGSPSTGPLRQGALAVPSEDYSHGPPCLHGLSECRATLHRRTAGQKKTMKAKTSFHQSRLANPSERLANTKAANSEFTLSAQLDVRPSIDFQRRWRNRGLSTSRLVRLLWLDLPELYERAEVVGRWVWIQFHQPPALEVRQRLAEFGFHWNRTRQAWQHPCGSQRRVGSVSNPRRRYLSYFPADVQPI